ncbi:MAG: hypothetical protein ACRC8Y_11685 [Chroococcales cyanobacterium]
MASTEDSDRLHCRPPRSPNLFNAVRVKSAIARLVQRADPGKPAIAPSAEWRAHEPNPHLTHSPALRSRKSRPSLASPLSAACSGGPNLGQNSRHSTGDRRLP